MLGLLPIPGMVVIRWTQFYVFIWFTYFSSFSLLQEALWVLSNIAAGTLEHKTFILSSEVVPLLIDLLSTAPFETRKEVAYTLGNICVGPTKGSDNKCDIIVDHLVPLVKGGCLPGFVNLVRSADLESARVGLQFLELVLIFYIVMWFLYCIIVYLTCYGLKENLLPFWLVY